MGFSASSIMIVGILATAFIYYPKPNLLIFLKAV
jgi:hypothetical protein